LFFFNYALTTSNVYSMLTVTVKRCFGIWNCFGNGSSGLKNIWWALIETELIS